MLQKGKQKYFSMTSNSWERWGLAPHLYSFSLKNANCEVAKEALSSQLFYASLLTFSFPPWHWLFFTLLFKCLAEVYAVMTRWSLSPLSEVLSCIWVNDNQQVPSLMFMIFNITLGRTSADGRKGELTLHSSHCLPLAWGISLKGGSLTKDEILLFNNPYPLPHPLFSSLATSNLLLELDNIYIYFYLYLRWITSVSLNPLLWRAVLP